MKKKNCAKGLILAFCLFFGIMLAGTQTAQPVKAAVKKTTTVTKAKKPVNGWYTFPSGRKRYYKNGKYLTGLKKVRNKTYLFSKRGVMLTGTQKIKNKVYYLNDKGVLQVKKLGNRYFYANGKKMSDVDAQDFATLQTAKEIVAQITNSSMTSAQKLKVCFDWVIKKPYWTWRTFSNFSGWPAVYAMDHFQRGRGNCMSDAAAFAYLAKAVGYKQVYVCVDSTGRNGSGHAWTEIGGLAYDPLFAEAKSYSANYGVPYGVYKLSPILHIAL